MTFVNPPGRSHTVEAVDSHHLLGLYRALAKSGQGTVNAAVISDTTG